MKRCAIYARFSTDRQNDKSIDDQVATCTAYAARNELAVIDVYADYAVSGASLHGRANMQRLLADAKDGRFDVLLCETLSRIGRDEGDRADVRKRLTFASVHIMTTVDGVVSRLTDGIKAVIDAQYIEDVRAQVRRGMAGVIRDGRHAGGRAYGYRKVFGRPGELEIDEDQAAVVRRIFSEYVAGRTPRAIAHGLNRDGITAPRGKAWNASTINGWGTRGAGILNNSIYRGLIIWNKNRMVKDPDTGRRVSRANPESEWQTSDAPALAIVPADVFERARARRAERGGTMPVHQRAPRHLFSGLLKCGACGSGMSAFGADRSGRRRIRCTGDSERGDCPAPRTFYLDAIETLVLDTLEAELRAPNVISAYVQEYHAERTRLAREAGKNRVRLERRLGAIAREAKRAVDGIVKGVGDPILLGARTKELAIERADVERELAVLPAANETIALHPAVLARYERQIMDLQGALARGIRAGDTEAAAAVRELIQRVTVRQTAEGVLSVEIDGHLSVLLGRKVFPSRSVVCGKAVAEARLPSDPPRPRLEFTLALGPLKAA